jgi:hypothetical protein
MILNKLYDYNENEELVFLLAKYKSTECVMSDNSYILIDDQFDENEPKLIVYIHNGKKMKYGLFKSKEKALRLGFFYLLKLSNTQDKNKWTTQSKG